MKRQLAVLLLAAAMLLTGGCALYRDVTISPLHFNPLDLDRGSDLDSMVAKADYVRACELAESIESRGRKSAKELLSLGTAELHAGRYDDARRHLRLALDLNPLGETAARIEWTLSQIEYMNNNFEASLEWAQRADDHGLTIRRWHIQFLEALSQVDAYRRSGLLSSQLPLYSSNPDIPRIAVRLNAHREATAVIDSGAVMSIASKRLAESLPIRIIGPFTGTFYGLLGEPIEVQFGLLDSVTLGDVIVENVPVAIMPDDKMHFVFNGRKEFAIDFLLGSTFLKEFRTDLNFPRNTVTFTHLTSFDRRPGPDQNLFIHGFRPFVRGTVNRKGWHLFMVDTGSEVTFLTESGGRLPLRQFAPKMHDAMLQGLGGARKRGAKVENVEIGIDRWAGTFRTVPMYESAPHESSAGIIGENFLKNFRVILDYGRMRMDLIRGGGVSHSRPPTMMTAEGAP